MQQDPIGEGMNWYAYAGNNPVAGIDPEGLVRADDVYDALGNFLGGATDTLSFGLTKPLRRAFGVREEPDPCSGWYTAGHWTGVGLQAVAGAAAGEAVATRLAGLGTKTLYRAVGEAELADIGATGVYRIAGSAAEYVKPFWSTEEEAWAFARAMSAKSGETFAITSGRFSTGVIGEAIPADFLGWAHYVPEYALPGGPVTILGLVP